MANLKHLDKLHAGVTAWNSWQQEIQQRNDRVGKRPIRPDLRGADLSRMKLTGVDFSYVDLTNVNLSNTDLTNSHLRESVMVAADLQFCSLRNANAYGADLSMANLREANLLLTNFTGANLSQARLQRANISRTIFNGCHLKGSDFAGAWIADVVLSNVDLTEVNGLDTARFAGPSSLGIEVLYQSGGGVPSDLLRKIGAPDNLITYAASLLTSPIQFYSCFISYSTEDQDFADRLYADLQANGVRCWFAPHDARFGQKLYDQIDQAIRVHEKLLLILSPNSMKSEWVRTEISRARQRELREKCQVLFPISIVDYAQIRAWECFDADVGKDSAREVREYLIADFSKWTDHSFYMKQFGKLLQDLKSDRIVAAT